MRLSAIALQDLLLKDGNIMSILDAAFRREII